MIITDNRIRCGLLQFIVCQHFIYVTYEINKVKYFKQVAEYKLHGGNGCYQLSFDRMYTPLVPDLEEFRKTRLQPVYKNLKAYVKTDDDDRVTVRCTLYKKIPN